MKQVLAVILLIIFSPFLLIAGIMLLPILFKTILSLIVLCVSFGLVGLMFLFFVWLLELATGEKFYENKEIQEN